MRTLVKMVAVVAVSAAMRIDAHTPKETNDVVQTMLEIVATSSDDNFDSLSRPWRVVRWSDKEKFFGIGIDGWTRDEKESAFLAYLNQLRSRNFLGQTPVLDGDARMAVWVCENASYTNSVPSLMGLITNRTCSVNLRCAAIRTFVKLCTVDDVATQFVENMITNTVKYGFRERGLICDHYAKKIYDMHTQDGRANSAKDRAVKMLYRYRLFDLVGTGLLDNLFTAYFSGYDVSSNRLEVATYILNHPKCDRYDRRDFASITNQLLSTGRTLEWLNIETGGDEQ